MHQAIKMRSFWGLKGWISGLHVRTAGTPVIAQYVGVRFQGNLCITAGTFTVGTDFETPMRWCASQGAVAL